MKKYFKYAFGYVNIDDQNIYLTATGNWSETHDLKEKGAQKQNTGKKFLILVFLIVAVIVLAGMAYYAWLQDRIGLFSAILMPFGIYGAYTYLKSELGEQFKLPIAKVLSITFSDHDIHLTFYNFCNQEEMYVIKNATPEGQGYMKEIHNRLGPAPRK